MRLNDFYQLFDQGKISEAFLSVETLEGDDQLEGELVKATFQLNFFGGVDRLSSLVKDLVVRTRENPLLQSLARATLAFNFTWKGNNLKAQAELEEALHLMNENPVKDRFSVPPVVVTLINAYYLQNMGKNAKALQIYSQIVQTASDKKFPLKILATTAYNNMGSIYESKGEWTRAIECHMKGMQILREIGNEIMRSYPLIKLGNLSHLQGKLDIATNWLQKGLNNARKFQDKRAVTWALQGLGSVSHTKVEYEFALKVYNEALQIIKTAKLASSDLSSTLYRLFLLHLDMEDPTQAKEYLRELQDRALRDNSLETKTLSLFAEALILKNSKRFKDKGHAQDLFQAIFESKKTRQQTRFLAMLHFCDLLLQEVRMSEDETIFRKAQVVAGNLYDLAQTSQFTPELINALVLRSKFALIEGDAHLALDMLGQAHTMAREKGLSNLMITIEDEQNILRKELNKWQDLINMNASLKERIKLTEIESYLKDAIKIRDRTLKLS